MTLLVTKANTKIFLGIASGDTSEDSLIDLLIAGCSARIESYCDRLFASAERTEFYEGTGTELLALRQRPVTAIANLWFDPSGYWGAPSGSFASATELVSGTDFALVKDQPDGSSRCGLVQRIGAVWDKPLMFQAGIIDGLTQSFLGNIKVKYTAAADPPDDVKQACYLLIAAVRNSGAFGRPLLGERWEDYGYNLQPLIDSALGGMPPEVVGILARYRNFPVG